VGELDAQAQRELHALFLTELGEHCQALTHAFLSLEKEPPAEEQQHLLGEAFRAAHSLKGAARAVGLGQIESLAHALEAVLADLQHGRLSLTPTLFDRLYATVDAIAPPEHSIAEAGAEQRAGPAAEIPVDALLQQLRAAQAESSPQAGLDAELPRASAASVPAVEPATAASHPPAPPAIPEDRPAARRDPVRSSPETIRLPAARLDTLLDQLGELVIPRLELTDSLSDLDGLHQEVEGWQRDWRKVRSLLRRLDQDSTLHELRPLLRVLERSVTTLLERTTRLGQLRTRLGGSLGQLRALTDDLQDDVKRLRMLPFGSSTDGFGRVVRDLARTLGKEARLVVSGADTELDRQVLDAIKDSLLHLLRNSLDHGIEPPEARRRLGKPVTGTVGLGAYQRGGTIVIEMEDDGAGLDPRVIRRAASDRRLLPATDLAAMSDRDIIRLIFEPGLSTSHEVSQVSGRGVGLDVVARTVERLGGRVDVQTTPGEGTLFRITLPLTLATARALLFEAGDGLYALDTGAIERVIRVEHLGNVGGRLMLEYEGVAVPAAILSELLHGRPSLPGAPGQPQTVALVGAGSQRVGLVIDRVSGEQEIVVKPLGYPLEQVRFFSGATILGSGQVVPILNVADLTRAAASLTSTATQPAMAAAEQRRLRVLVADDSLTTRTLERYILEAAGYEVALAGDGLEALALLSERECDVLVSDVDMPHLDGVSLTVQVRQVPRFRELPIILVTSLASAEDRERGLQAGADAYMVKSSFDQDQLLRTIQELV
jgi:two-component system chemotaxis sensor kinase CheA